MVYPLQACLLADLSRNLGIEAVGRAFRFDPRDRDPIKPSRTILRRSSGHGKRLAFSFAARLAYRDSPLTEAPFRCCGSDQSDTGCGLAVRTSREPSKGEEEKNKITSFQDD
jgi:hypothetical protein